MREYKATIGIDPGQSGAMALLLDGTFVHVEDFDRYICRVRLIEWDLLYDIRLVVLEKVASMPGQGVSSTFAFGENFGWWQGILEAARVPHRKITPGVWMRGMGIAKKKKDSDKPSLEVARQMFPNAPLPLQKHHGRADAILMAYKGFQIINGEVKL